MNQQPDLLSWTPPRYPDRAGFKDQTTSKDAADAIEASGRAARLRAATLELYCSGFIGTADEAAHALGENILSIRPRITEWRGKGFLERTGERRAMDGGKPGHVLRAVRT